MIAINAMTLPQDDAIARSRVRLWESERERERESEREREREKGEWERSCCLWLTFYSLFCTLSFLFPLPPELRASKRKPPPKKTNGGLPKKFDCPWCNHELACDVTM